MEFKIAHIGERFTCGMGCLTHWLPLLVGWIMANWDAAIDRSQGRWGLGVILRDHARNMIVVKCSTQLGYLNPDAAEA